MSLVGHGGAFKVPGREERVFAKLLPLTPLEAQEEGFQSTANRYGLPTVYQNRFGGWR